MPFLACRVRRSSFFLASEFDWSDQSVAFVAVAYPTRLETRTKESNIRASLRVENPWA